MNELNKQQRLRYTRHLTLPQIGEEGQSKLQQSSVLIIGAGGLGSPVALYLCAAGVGNIGIIDGDEVDLSNLQRQIVHNTLDLNRPKAISAKEKLRALNPDVNVIAYPFRFTSDNARELLNQYDFIIDATDNFSSKFLINDECVKAGKPFTIGAIFQFQGQLLTHIPGTACYRCLFDSTPDTSEPLGPISPLPGVVGSLQATEAIKYITHTGTLLTNTLLTIDTLSMQFDKFAILPHKDCECQSKGLVMQ